MDSIAIHAVSRVTASAKISGRTVWVDLTITNTAGINTEITLFIGNNHEWALDFARRLASAINCSVNMCPEDFQCIES